MKKIIFISILSIVLILSLHSISAFDWTKALGYWNMDNASLNASDSVDTHTFVVQNYTFLSRNATDCISEFCLRLNGSVQASGKTSLNLSTMFISTVTAPNGSLSFWTRFNTETNPVFPVSRLLQGSSTHYSMNINSTTINLDVDDTNQNFNVATLKNSWHHIVMAWNSTSTAIYVDTNFIGSVVDTPKQGTDTTGDKIFAINAPGAISDTWLDEYGFFNKTLNSSDINELYNGGKGIGFNGTIIRGVTVNITSPIGSTNDNPVFINASYVSSLSTSLTNATLFLWDTQGNPISFSFSPNVSFTGKTNTSSFNVSLPYGYYTANMFACNNNNYCSFQPLNSTFYVGISFANESFNQVTIPGATENFGIAINFNSTYFQSISGILNYNGTFYSGSMSGSDGNRIFNVTITIPATNITVNNPFVWSFTLYNGSTTFNINATQHTQQVLSLNADNCTSNTVLLYNITANDEDTQAMLDTSANTNLSVNVNINVSSLDRNMQAFFFAKNFTRTNPMQICMNQNLSTASLRVDGTLQYSASNYVTEFYTIQNATITNLSLPQNINLYDLLISRSQSFLIIYKDKNLVPQSNVIIDISRYYVGNGYFKTVELPITDGGSTYGHFVTQDVLYTLYARREGNLLGVYPNVRVACQNQVIGDCEIDLKEQSGINVANSFINYNNLSYSFTYNDTLKQAQFMFSSLDNAVHTMVMNITQDDGIGNTVICTTSLVSTSGTVFCQIPSQFQNIAAVVNIYEDGVLFLRQPIVLHISNSANLTVGRYFLAAIVILSIPLIGIAGGIVPTIVMFAFGLIGAVMFYLLDSGGFIGTTSALLWIFIACAILIWKATHRRST